ncbi:hypothetical protein DSCA_11880 [Desulfosarcina alkanivorans]|uniref:Uncharacterized protein n=2 Tax=Desulfosarcina alkanivorans TaxID=571177 RepID=A0A5K7YDV6_9BACT|nr:hypothetical protein DSCA_11880 [Desulfosarcina alkanivorans]
MVNLKKISQCIMFLQIITMLYLFFPISVFAGVNLPWSTTYDCPEFIQGSDDLNCDGLQEAGGWTDSCGNHEQITSAANNPSGGGGRGQRHWYGPGTNSNSGGLNLTLSEQPNEIWFRWYMRVPEGLSWDRLNYDKLIYIYLHPTSVDSEIILEWAGGDGFKAAKQGMLTTNSPTGSGGWATTMGRSIYEGGDGQWHYFEAHIKIDTNGSNGIMEMWIDDRKIIDEHNVDWGGFTQGNLGIRHILIGSNQEDVAASSGCQPVDFDDIAISSTGRIGPLGSTPITTDPAPTCSDGVQNGDETGIDCGGSCLPCNSYDPVDPVTGLMKQTQIMSESFENNSWSSRGWYDGTDSTGTALGGYQGNALRWTWTTGSTRPTGFSTIRRVLDESVDEFLIEYYVKHDTGWQGSGLAWHPHLIHVLSSEDTAYQGFAGSNSNLYFESIVSNGKNYPVIHHQDLVRAVSGTNDLTEVTESRSANHCDTPYALTGATSGTCYDSGGWYSASTWNPKTVAIPANVWTKITAYVKMNTFSSGVANFDGIMKLWVNDSLAIDSNTVLYAAGAYEGATWDKLALAPWIGDGSPVNQTMWLDELSIWSVQDTGNTIDPPSGVTLVN